MEEIYSITTEKGTYNHVINGLEHLNNVVRKSWKDYSQIKSAHKFDRNKQKLAKVE